MNQASPSTPRRTRTWWGILIATMIVGPFFPYFFTIIGFGWTDRDGDLGGLVLGTEAWFLMVIVVTVITGWHVSSGHRTGAKVGLTLLFTLAACSVGLGLGIAECSAARAIWPNFLK